MEALSNLFNGGLSSLLTGFVFPIIAIIVWLSPIWLLIFISRKIWDMQNSQSRAEAIGVLIVIELIIIVLIFSYFERKNDENHSKNCEKIREKIYNFEGKYTNASMSDEWSEIYKLCIMK